MKKELPKAYDAKLYEDAIYKRWEESGFFNPDVCIEKGITDADAEPFSIVLPPPNVTGTLHIGHAVMLAIEDVMVRYHRMKGDRTLWVPGTDHASIATQEKVERLMWKEEQKTRHDLGREEFLKRVDQFAQDSHDTIVNQAKKMGTSMDWSREYYSLDEPRNAAVNEAFAKMYKDGLIYRGDRIVNWDPKMQSNVSNIEVERKEEKSTFYYFQYGPFVIGTSRPETKFGDKYVVMHPEDERYAQYKHGDKFTCEWINGPIEATILKDEAVDPEFGTGVMTITPWHDATDFFMAERHDLEKEQVIDFEGNLMAIAEEFAGMHILDARPKIVEKLDAKGLVVKIDEDYMHAVATNIRGGGLIEPQIMKQWWVNVNKEFVLEESKIDGIESGDTVTLKKLLQHVVRNNNIEILPERFEKQYFNWVDNLLDWCLSRQLWFGHRVPAWYKKLEEPVKITFVRHGQSESNLAKVSAGQLETPLTEQGKEEALNMKESLGDLSQYDAVYCSDMGRAKKTADIIFEGAAYTTDSRLKEINYGDLAGAPLADIDELRTSTYPNGESYVDVANRVSAFLSEIAETHSGKHIVIVGHTGTYRVLAHLLADMPMTRENLSNHVERKPFHFKLSELVHVSETAPEGDGWQQDPDTLDTWFSAGMFSFSPLGPVSGESEDQKTYHPTSVLETGYDILTFWIVRMIMMTTYLRAEIPFKTVYLHGLVRDEQGRKMSKSLEGFIDPLDVSEQFGTDAVRLSLLIGASPGNDSKLSVEKIGGYRNFANKLWNIARFTIGKIQETRDNLQPDIARPEGVTLADKWILARTDAVIAEVTAHIENHRLSPAGELLRDFTWTELADWYLEVSKVESDKTSTTKADILNYVLNTILKMWHPYMPFVTEAIWQEVYGEDAMLMVARWPALSLREESENNDAAISSFKVLQAIITGIRSVRAEYGIEPAKFVRVVIRSKEHRAFVGENLHVIESLARVESITLSDDADTEGLASFIEDGIEVFVDMAGAVDIEKEKARIQKEIDNVAPYIKQLEGKLSGPFAANAPEAVVEKERAKLAEAKEKIEVLGKQLQGLR